MTVHVVAVSQAEADSLAHLIGYKSKATANVHLAQVKAPPTDDFYAAMYKVWTCTLAGAAEGE